ncbi:hypothetical protein FGO68_gene9835 [Halteria grandinella]|uniref:HpcH/HpaI aldolase/citrate lyase domain-containing protein n=1 Tax=Halteria grandinella TaxID=5974 RepID=A0A8J8NL07_HALGN|nr:hypothetical protein FGO68_gene9835 [Halteria grandinella]
MKQFLSLQCRGFSRRLDPNFLTSGLYVPGNQQKMLTKCVTTKASLLVPDMEDSVPEGQEKVKARELIRQNLKDIRAKTYDQRVIITPRTNGITTGLFKDDVEGVLTKETIDSIDGFCVPKVDTSTEYKQIDTILTTQENQYGLPIGHFKLIPQIESTLSLMNAKDIFSLDRESNKRILAAAFGADDFTADFEIDRQADDGNIQFHKKLFALACHAFNVVSIDTPYVHYKDLDGLRKELGILKSFGMKAKFAIHPTQVDVINEVLRPSAEEVKYYREMIAQFEEAQVKTGKAAIQFQGKMVDIAAYRRAKAIVKRAE